MSFANKKVLVLGAGRIGFAVAILLEEIGQGKFEVILGDRKKDLRSIPAGLTATRLIKVDATILADLKSAIPRIAGW